MSNSFHAALTWEDERLAFLLPDRRSGLHRRLELARGGEGFGLLEPDANGWTLCIPAGADAEARVDDERLDLAQLSLEPSGERRLRVCAGLRACVSMGEFRFELSPAEA